MPATKKLIILNPDSLLWSKLKISELMTKATHLLSYNFNKPIKTSTLIKNSSPNAIMNSSGILSRLLKILLTDTTVILSKVLLIENIIIKEIPLRKTIKMKSIILLLLGITCIN